MVIVQIIGGLGNQMFQYALGKHLSLKTGAELKLDNTQFSWYKLHNYSLHHFNILQPFASLAEINRLRYGVQNHLMARFIESLNRAGRFCAGKNLVQPRTCLREERMEFDQNVLQASDGVYLEGYWQSEKYFSEIRSVLLQDFAIVTPSDTANSAMLELIRTSNSVSLHVRRGDYANNSRTQQIYGCCGMEYYQAAIRSIQARIEDARFFIFSDDPDWAEENLPIPGSTVVRGNDASKNYEDLRLMNACRHNITANSSFSWWGAWLNQNPQKIVIAPSRWALSSKLNSSDIVPASWERI
ncbi:MAG TPA: alpha-1,2-fucosyltransferase [Candidatus Rifleibacterium sp.]|nr:alpha-1,2-fucosyltransferase [Candidatus Rifleibacterium sp.]HPT47308.1 alpha-1,2-fucosyltransferase [Candidatus Rifleibacterium sp.]